MCLREVWILLLVECSFWPAFCVTLARFTSLSRSSQKRDFSRKSVGVFLELFVSALDWVSVASNCSLGLFWGRNLDPDSCATLY